MYALYHDRKQKIIQVKKAPKALQDIEYTDEVRYYNNCYFICLKKKLLLQKAEEMKQQWIAEAEKELEQLKAIIIC